MSHADPDIRRLMRAERYLKRAITELSRMETVHPKIALQILPLQHVRGSIERDTQAAVREYARNRA